MKILQWFKNLFTVHEHHYILRYDKINRTIVPECKCGNKKQGFRPQNV